MNSGYWEDEGATKTFTHKLSPQWIQDLPGKSLILDLGCGYGRITKQLFEAGYTRIIGYDPSKAMIARALQENPGPTYTSSVKQILQEKFDLVICFALFTSCPEPDEQEKIKNLIEKQTCEHAHLYISDLLLSKNEHYTERYKQRRLGIYGCFRSGETAIFRHHSDDHFSQLFPELKELKERTYQGETLTGNTIHISQFLLQKQSTVLSDKSQNDDPSRSIYMD